MLVIFEDPLSNLEMSDEGQHSAEALTRKLRATSVMKGTTDEPRNIARASKEEPSMVETSAALPGNEQSNQQASSPWMPYEQSHVSGHWRRGLHQQRDTAGLPEPLLTNPRLSAVQANKRGELAARLTMARARTLCHWLYKQNELPKRGQEHSPASCPGGQRRKQQT